MNSTTSYQENKQRIINRYWGAEDSILSLENAIEMKPISSRSEYVSHGYAIYKKIAYPQIYDRFMNPKDTITVIYGVHVENGNIILFDIF